MLVLKRKVGEEVVIDGRITIKVLEVRGSRVRLGFEAPDDVAVYRQELVDKVGETCSEAVLEGVLA